MREFVLLMIKEKERNGGFDLGYLFGGGAILCSYLLHRKSQRSRRFFHSSSRGADDIATGQQPFMSPINWEIP